MVCNPKSTDPVWLVKWECEGQRATEGLVDQATLIEHLSSAHRGDGSQRRGPFSGSRTESGIDQAAADSALFGGLCFVSTLPTTLPGRG
jgi:hypothetical protein